MPFVPTPPPWIVWSPDRVRYTLMNLDALYKLCRLHSTNMQVLVGHKAGNTNGTLKDVRWLRHEGTKALRPARPLPWLLVVLDPPPPTFQLQLC